MNTFKSPSPHYKRGRGIFLPLGERDEGMAMAPDAGTRRTKEKD
jgi:hypothetical protein